MRRGVDLLRGGRFRSQRRKELQARGVLPAGQDHGQQAAEAGRHVRRRRGDDLRPAVLAACCLADAAAAGPGIHKGPELLRTLVCLRPGVVSTQEVGHIGHSDHGIRVRQALWLQAASTCIRGVTRVYLRAYQEFCSLKHRGSAVPLGGQGNAGASAGLPALAVRQP